MAKKKDPNMSEDRVPKTTVGGVNPNLLKATIKSCSQIDADLAEARGDKAAALERFTDGGGNKKMLKWSMSIAGMEADDAKDSLSTLFEYLKAQGIVSEFKFTMAQGELFGSDKEDEGDGEDDEGAEPSVGQQQAAAFGRAHGTA